MKPTVEIFSQGEEVVIGQIADTNAAWLSQRLNAMGFLVTRHTAVGDKLTDLKQLLLEIAERADCCICSGGLGPTVDDLTAQAVAEAFGLPLQLDEVALQQIEQYFACRNRTMADANRKQALLPQGGKRLDNHWGTAPGFSLKHKRCLFFFVPGVPGEMKKLFDEHIEHALTDQFVLQADKLFTLRVVGIGESNIQQKLNQCLLPQHIQLSFRTGADENQVKLLFPANMQQHAINEYIHKVALTIGDYVFAIDGPDNARSSLVNIISDLMTAKNYSLSVCETASQGLIAAKCIGNDWLLSSRFYKSLQALASAISFTPEQDDLAANALRCARKIQQQESSDLVLVQFYQGAAEQFSNKENLITVYNVLLTPEGSRQTTHQLAGTQHRKQNQAAVLALDLLRRYLQNKCH